MGTVLPLFWHLSSASKKERLDASVKLIGILERFQEQFVTREQSPGAHSHSDDEDGQEESAQKSRDDGLSVLNAHDVSYSIRRLIRGLASPRESSRLGFAVALTELLSRVNTITCIQITALIMDSSKPQGSMTGQEERDMLFARLFGLMSVIQSGLLVRQGSLRVSASSSAEVSTLSGYTDVISQLVSLGEKKSWLRESAWFAILLGIDILHESEVAWKTEAIEATIQQVFVEYKVWSPEKVAVALKLQSLYPKKDWSKLLSPTFKNGGLLSSANLQTLARILKESGAEGENESASSGGGSWRPQLHFVWDYLLDQFFPGPNSGHAPKGSFQDFFRVAVDESLFSFTSSPQRKYWGFQVFQKALCRIDEGHISMLFTKNFMRSWINHLSNRDRYLHKIAQLTATEVQAFVRKNPQLGFSLILQLTGAHGNQQFDRLTKTKTIESILASTDVAGIEKYIQWLFSQVDEPGVVDTDAIQAVNTRRQWVVDQLGALIRNGAIPKNDEWIQSILDWLVVHGLFIVRKKSSKNLIVAAQSIVKPPFSDDLRKSCRARLLSCLSDLNTQTTVFKIGDNTIKVSAVASNNEFWVSRVLSRVTQLEADTKHVSLLAEVDQEDQELRSRAWDTMKRLKTVTGDGQETARGAELLLAATTLQQYCTDNEEDVENDALQACIDGVESMFPVADKKGKKALKQKTEEAHQPLDILVDTIIGFLEKSTTYLRTTANEVFALLSDSVMDSTVDLILTQLERRDPTADSGEEDGGEDMDMEGDEDEDQNGSERDQETDESSDQEADVDTETEDEGIDDDEALELRNKIEEALRVNGIEPATGDTESEEEELMDDDQMMAIDEQLAQVFRSQAHEGKSKKDDAQREATHFKNRVLDLVEIFIRKQPSNPLVLRFISPLVDLITGTSLNEQQLADKAKGILRSRVAKLKEIPRSVTKEDIAAVLEDVHNHSKRAHASDLLPMLSQCSLYLSKILLHLEAQDTVLETYRSSLVDFLTRKNSAFNTNFFQDFLRRYPPVSWGLRDDLLGLSGRAINGYRQSQAIQLLETLINQISSSSEHKNELVAFIPSLSTALHNIASSACRDQATLTSAQLKEIMKLALIALRLTQRLAPEQLQDIWEPGPWIKLKNDFASCPRLQASTNLQKVCETISTAQQKTCLESIIKPKKRKAAEPDPVAEKTKTNRKKAKEK